MSKEEFLKVAGDAFNRAEEIVLKKNKNEFKGYCLDLVNKIQKDEDLVANIEMISINYVDDVADVL